MGAVATVRIVSPKDPGRFLRINAADLDPARHILWERRHERPAVIGAGEPYDHDANRLRRLLRSLPDMPRGELLRAAAGLGLKLDRRFRVQKLREELAELVQTRLAAGHQETRS